MSLQSLLAELSNESAQPVKELDVGELLQYSVEASQIEIGRAFNLMTTMEQNFQKHFGGDVTATSFEAYQHDTTLALLAAGIDVPVVLIAPSFEAVAALPAPADQKKEVGDKKDNVIKRGLKAVWDMLVRLKDWIVGLFKKKEEEVEKVAEELVAVQAEAKKNVTALKALPAPKAEALEKMLASGSQSELVVKATDVVGSMKVKFKVPKKHVDGKGLEQTLAELKKANDEIMTVVKKSSFTIADVGVLARFSDEIETDLKGQLELVEVEMTMDQFNGLVNGDPLEGIRSLRAASKAIQDKLGASADYVKKLTETDNVPQSEIASAKLDHEVLKAASDLLIRSTALAGKHIKMQIAEVKKANDALKGALDKA